MPQTIIQVRPAVRSKADISAALSAGWARIINKTGRGKFADKLGVDSKTISRALSGEHLPGLDTAFNSLVSDVTALDELAALYGLEIRPRQMCASNDMATIGMLAHLAGQWIEVMADGVRDHRETLEIAAAVRPLVPCLQAVIAEADRLRGVAA